MQKPIAIRTLILRPNCRSFFILCGWVQAGSSGQSPLVLKSVTSRFHCTLK